MKRRREVFAVLSGWTLAGALLAAQAYVSGHLRGDPVDGWQALGIWLAWAYGWALLTPGIVRLERILARPGAAWLHALAAPCFAAVNLALFAAIAPVLGAENAASTWSGTFRNLLGSAFILNVPVYLLVVGIARWTALSRAARLRETRELLLEHQLSQAKLLTLRSQLQPHFLFNALNTVSVLMHEDVEKADQVLILLASLLRGVLNASDEGVAKLSTDLALARTYLQIEQARFGARLNFVFDIDPAAERCECPTLLLQPLVENCVRHAVNARLQPTNIEVAARKQGGEVCITVRDDGPGLRGDARTGGVGLANTRARLSLLYADRHSFIIENQDTGGVRVRIALPCRTADEDPIDHR